MKRIAQWLIGSLLALATIGGPLSARASGGLTVTASPAGAQKIGITVTITVDDSYHCNYTSVTFTYTIRVAGANTQTQSVEGSDRVTFTYVGALPGIDEITVTASGHFSFGPCQSTLAREGSTTHVWTV